MPASSHSWRSRSSSGTFTGPFCNRCRSYEARLIEQNVLRTVTSRNRAATKPCCWLYRVSTAQLGRQFPRIMEKRRRDKACHHFTYEIARSYALGGKDEEALKLAVHNG